MIKLWNPEGAGDRPGPAVSDAEFMAELEKLHAERPEAADRDPDPDGGSVLDCLARLVAAFDADDGQCDDVYHATVGLLHHHLGGRAVRAFCRHLAGCDDRHFLPEGSLPAVLRDIRRAAGRAWSASGE
ncbi:MAG: hypothetical protein ACKODX_11680 [Gemmata sp.]